VSTALCQRQPFRLRARSFMAFVLAPEPPFANWLAELDEALRRSAGFFAGRPVVLDLTAVKLGRPDLTQLIADLNARDIRILGMEGVSSSLLGLGLPPRLHCGRLEGGTEMLSKQPAGKPSSEQTVKPRSLLLEEPVRSGQSVVFLGGDVTVVGSVASGADIVAGGSIHVYGALRGRALAGANGNAAARIFCSRNEAELLAVDGAYRTADDMEVYLRSQPIQARLEGGTLAITALD
jgi:septum site-determining protein MinC